MKNRTFVNLIAIAVGIYGWCISFFSIFKTGLGWDSVYDLDAAKISLQNARLTNLADFYDLVPITSEFYGTFMYKIANFISIQVMDESIFNNTLLLKNYYIMDVTTWMISLLSILIVCYVLVSTFSSYNQASLFFGIISTLPIWVGMSQVNSKDIPVSAGLTILSSGFMLIQKSIVRRYFYLGIIFTSLGAGIALAVRPASALIIIMFVLINCLILIYIDYIKTKSFFILFDIFKIFIFTLLISLFILYISNPISISNLFTWIVDAVRVSLNYPSVQPVRIMGKDFMSNDLPKWYVLAWIWAQMPILTFASLMLSLIFILKRTFLNLDIFYIFKFSPFLIQALLVPFIFLFTQPNLYNGIRHILFVFPALIVISVIYLNEILNKFELNYMRSVSCIFVAAVLLLNTFATFRWQPYSYAFINPVAGIGDKRNWDLDYWGLSSREGIERLINLGYAKDVIVMPDSSSSIPFGGKSANQIANSNLPFNLYVFIHWNHKILEENCVIDFRIKRDNQLIGMGGHCFKKF